MWGERLRGRTANRLAYAHFGLPIADSPAALQLDLRIDEPLQPPLSLAMTCGRNCAGVVDITRTVNAKIAPGEWGHVSVALACFARAGMDFSRVRDVLVFSDSDAMALSVANIKLVPGSAQQAALRCEPAVRYSD